jgi:outer membrane protein OmpA-like peptidoglycan-associated protein
MLRRLSRTAPHLQCKLEIGAFNDPLETEADRTADQVMRMSAPPPAAANGLAALRRKCAECEEEDQKLQKKSAGPAEAGAEAPESVRHALGSAGQPLESSARAFMEPRFGRDLSHVRVHTGSQVEESARDVHARAYTVGHDMVFAPGQYNPSSSEGRHLLAHELSHTIQQSGGDASALRREPAAPEQAAAPGPAACETGDPVFTPGDTFRFVINTDNWKDGADAGLLDTLQTYPKGSNFVIDGFASTDGPKEFNESLSCKRALKAKALMVAAGIDESRILHIVGHGPTPGKAEDRRSVVIHPIAPPAQQQQPDAKQPDAKQPDAKQPDKKQQDDGKKDDTKKDDNKPADPNAPPPAAPDLNPRLVIQIPITATNFVFPFGKPGGIGVTPPGGGRSTALDQSYQPNAAFGFNYNFTNNDTGPALGAFVQFGANMPLSLGGARPVTLSGVPTSFTGMNIQGYLQPTEVIYSKDGVTMAFLLQPGIGRTFDSKVKGTNGVTYSFQGGYQITKDIIKNKLQLYGQIMVGAGDTKIDDPDPGKSAWQGLQPFFGFSIGVQPLITLMNYPPKPDPDK